MDKFTRKTSFEQWFSLISTELFNELVENRRKTSTPWMLIDSTTLPLNLTNHRWAEFRKTKSGVKLHLRLVFMEKGLSYPDKAVMTNAIEHDRGQLEIFIDDKECMYVF